MNGDCRRSPIGKKTVLVSIEPNDPTQFELVEIFVFASQENQWRGTNVRVELTCPGLRGNITGEVPNGTGRNFANVAGVKVGHYRGTARCSWPNGQKLVEPFLYEVKR